eukprot:TRINITY_DN35339_c1_g1_i4.p1 TRINITY_DN35339_c1_g1~~TRINITY_DN35339_c1_g1_i4.p1  ORF type:complete len:647 (+),score=132.64 TRINITY_DN35339_c1_g1_i4:121-2061(+)
MVIKSPNPIPQNKTIFNICKSISQFKQAHAHLLIRGVPHPQPPPSSLFPFFSSSSSSSAAADTHYALLLLSLSPSPPSLFLLNTFIRSLVRRPGSNSTALHLFDTMLQSGLTPNSFTFTFLFQSCANSLALRPGLQLHSMVVKNSMRADVFVRNSIIRFYSVCAELDDARKVFDEGGELDVVSWNSMIDGCVRNGEVFDALHLFDRMPERNVVSWNSVISGLVQCGRLDDAQRLFDEMPERNIASWVVMISGCAQNGLAKEAMEVFQEMQLLGQESNAAVLVSVFSACSQLGALSNGIWIHTYIQKNSVKMDTLLSAALIDMYAKCGSIDLAMQAFGSCSEKDVFVYTAAIHGLAINGLGEEALLVFENMRSKGIRPDCICFMAVLCACSHMGLVEKGLYYFNSMVEVHGIEAELDHYACIVDLLGRAGLLEEAEGFITSMPIKPDNIIWGALLGACRIHNNAEMARRIGNSLIESDHGYVLLSNIYAEASKRDDAEEVRKTMKRRRIKRVPGSSSIEVNGIVHEFVAGDRSHQKADEIYMAWEEIVKEIRKVGYAEDTRVVIFDVNEEEKEGLVGYHSEKLAVAFGFISTEPGSLLRIVKNLRICQDCHSALKLVSMVFKRKIVVRDRKRFHHFEGGSCSCVDYW